jgi:hypothetical protein
MNIILLKGMISSQLTSAYTNTKIALKMIESESDCSNF